MPKKGLLQELKGLYFLVNMKTFVSASFTLLCCFSV